MTLGTRRYAAADVARADAYERVRLRVLFEKWCPGRPTSCSPPSCAARAASCPISHGRTRAIWPLNTGRSWNGDRTTEPARPTTWPARGARNCMPPSGWRSRQTPCCVLDYGGGDGRLMHAFRAGGHRTFLVDYQERPVAELKSWRIRWRPSRRLRVSI